jgi:hypothetical protein
MNAARPVDEGDQRATLDLEARRENLRAMIRLAEERWYMACQAKDHEAMRKLDDDIRRLYLTLNAMR